MPDALYGKLKARALERQTTLRDLILQAVQATLDTPERPPFRLRDASAGKPLVARGRRVNPADVNAMIDGMRENISR